MVEEQTPAPPAPPTPPSQGSTGLDPKIAGLLAYLFGWLSGLIIYLIEKDNKEVRFHALQSIAFSVVIGAISIVLGIFTAILSAIFFSISASLGLLISSLVGLVQGVVYLGALVIWIILMVKAYNEEHYKLPVIGNMVEKYV